MGQYLDFNYVFNTVNGKGSTICQFASGSLGIKDDAAIYRTSLLEGDALPLSADPVVQCAENTEGVKGAAAFHPPQACSLSQPYPPKHCHRFSKFKTRLRVSVNLVPLSSICPL